MKLDMIYTGDVAYAIAGMMMFMLLMCVFFIWNEKNIYPMTVVFVGVITILVGVCSVYYTSAMMLLVPEHLSNGLLSLNAANEFSIHDKLYSILLAGVCVSIGSGFIVDAVTSTITYKKDGSLLLSWLTGLLKIIEFSVQVVTVFLLKVIWVPFFYNYIFC